MASAFPPDAPDTLNGWKEIAAYLGKSVRSVQRWERELRLPVHRINTPDGGQIIFGTRLEIDEWKCGQDAARPSRDPMPEPTGAPAPVPAARMRWPVWPTGRAAFLVLGVVIGAMSVALIRFSIPGRPDRFELDDNTLTAYMTAGTPVWTAPLVA